MGMLNVSELRPSLVHLLDTGTGYTIFLRERHGAFLPVVLQLGYLYLVAI